MSERAHPPFQTCLRRGVHRRIGEADQTRAGRHRDHQSGPLTPHHRQHRSRHVHRADQVDRQLLVNLTRRHLLEEPLERRTGAVHQHIDATEPLDRRNDGSIGLLAVGDIQLHGHQIVANTETLDHLIGPAGRRDHAMPSRERRLDQGRAQTSRGTRDHPDRHLPIVAHHRAGRRPSRHRPTSKLTQPCRAGVGLLGRSGAAVSRRVWWRPTSAMRRAACSRRPCRPGRRWCSRATPTDRSGRWGRNGRC